MSTHLYIPYNITHAYVKRINIGRKIRDDIFAFNETK